MLHRLILFGIIIVTPLLYLIVAGFSNRFRGDRHFAEILLRDSQQYTTRQLQGYLETLRQQLEQLERLPALREFPAPGAQHIFQQYLALHPEFTQLLLLDRTGTEVLSGRAPGTPPASSAPDRVRWDWPQLLSTTGFAVSDAVRDPATGRWIGVVVLPGAKRPDLLLGAAFDLERLARTLLHAPEERKLTITVLDAAGTVVLSAGALADPIGTPLPLGVRLRQEVAAGRLAGKIERSAGSPLTYQAGRLPGSGWLVLATMSADDIYLDARRDLGRVLGYMLVVGLLYAALVVLYARALSSPITALAVAARAQTNGPSSLLAPESGPEEIALTARAFNLMVAGRRRAEEALGESERRHRELFQRNPHPMYVYDLASLRLIDVNESALRHYGYSREEFLQLTLCVLQPPEAAPVEERYLAQLRARGGVRESTTEVVRHRRRDGGLITVKATSHLLEQAGTRARLVLADDITAQLQAARALEESERRYRTIIDQTGQIVYDVDIPTRTAQWFGSEAVPALSGYSLEEFRAFDLAQVAACIHPEDTPAVAAYFEGHLAIGGPYHIDYRFRHRDGTYRLVEDVGIYLRDAAGRSVRALGRMSDITDQRRAAAALRQVIDLVPHLIYARDANGRYLLANEAAARAYGTTPGQMLGRTDAELAPTGEQAARFLNTDRIVLQTGRPYRVPAETIVTRAGATLHLSTVKIPFQMPGVEGPAVLGMSVDITELRQAEEARQLMEKKLLETQKLESLGVLAGGIAHDFNNLLTGILGNANLAQFELPDGHPGAAFLLHIEKAALRAADLCKQMLAYSGRGRFQIRRLNLNDLIEDTVRLLHLSLSKKATLRLDLTRPLPPVQGDATQLRQVLMNLVINASEALGDRPGRIRVHTGTLLADAAYLATVRYTGELPAGEYVFLEIEDDGCGMDPPTLARVFDPFFTTKFTGRGLGLAAVLGIVRGHAGAIKVASDPAQGTVFRVLLPAAAGPAPAPETLPVATVSWRGTGRILIVDDEETVRQVAVTALQHLGFTTESAADGLEALEIFRRRPAAFDLVLLDLTMPRMDGEEAFHQLRLLRPDVKAVLMSGYNRVEAVDRFLAKGLTGFVQKPFAVEELIAELRRVLAE